MATHNKGIVWKTALFLLGLVLFALLFRFLRSCDDRKASSPFERRTEDTRDARPNLPFDDGIGNFDPDSLDRTFRDAYWDMPEELREDAPVEDWGRPISGVDELPDPSRNYIPPVDSTRMVENPLDSLSRIVSDELIVFFNSKDVEADIAKFARRFKQLYPQSGYEVKYYNTSAGSMILGVPQDHLIETMQELPQKITDIDFIVVTNEILSHSAAGAPSDPGFAKKSYDAYYRLIQAYDAWEITKGSADIKVAIVDSYFDLSNPEIGQRYVDRINIPTHTTNVLPPARAPQSEGELVGYCHGSHVAGIAIGAQNNRLGCSGIAPECTWIPVSLSDQLTLFNIIEGVLYGIYRGADVVSFSIGRTFPQEAKQLPLGDQVTIATTMDNDGAALWAYVVKVANDHNCVLVTSAGNDTVLMGMDPKNRPESFIKVEAVDEKGIAAPFSNYGVVPEAGLNYSTIAAPGVKIWSVSDKRCLPIWEQLGYTVDQQQGFQEMDGTSMAAPVVAGAVALLKSKNKKLTPEQVIKILTMTAKQTDTEHRIAPTLQIRDALDATGGELVNFDDLMNNHELLIGKWRSTYELMIENNGNKVDDIWTYFIFDTENSGVVEHHTINMKRVYRARVSVRWEKDRIVINELENATDSATGDQISTHSYICRPDSNRLLSAVCVEEGVEKFDFQLEKVN